MAWNPKSRTVARALDALEALDGELAEAEDRAVEAEEKAAKLERENERLSNALDEAQQGGG